ncbi:TIM complex component Tim54 [Coleophoma crateriformis]|uniref:Mitochondrial import inner membrane translocase subunit TIM54 n=1 Tax=Coleophoma crateriformis TaxID=565419 RepID=A0A3D8RD13_9HELO|nr:TIM complex component Tim54 [Coleophoma crateriformis]
MADSISPPAENAGSASKPAAKPDTNAAKPTRPPNPIYKYMGLGENFRPKLPSRNWTIFLTITGSFAAAVIYDKREKKRAQRKWCKLVEHIAKEPLDPRSMPRKLTVFLEAPPSDGLRISQDHFKEYVKPILVASGLDWDFIQGRKEGDIRAELAEKIRTSRLPADLREEDAILNTRRQQGVKDFDGPNGDIVIGRHTWKEYVRGLHEGWLGPLTEPPRPEPAEVPVPEAQAPQQVPETLPGITVHSSPGQTDAPPVNTPAVPDEKPKKPSPFIKTSEYNEVSDLAHLPQEFDPSQPIAFPHILGFFNTPTRLYRFLLRRRLADSIGRDTAAIILSTYRPYTNTSISSELSPASPEAISEQDAAMITEEKEWHKSVHKHTDDEPERTWLEPMVLDPRIASRMRKAELTPEDEERARKIVVSEEEVEGWIKGGIRSGIRGGVSYLGLGKKSDEKTSGEDEILE